MGKLLFFWHLLSWLRKATSSCSINRYFASKIRVTRGSNLFTVLYILSHIRNMFMHGYLYGILKCLQIWPIWSSWSDCCVASSSWKSWDPGRSAWWAGRRTRMEACYMCRKKIRFQKGEKDIRAKMIYYSYLLNEGPPFRSPLVGSWIRIWFYMELCFLQTRARAILNLWFCTFQSVLTCLRTKYLSRVNPKLMTVTMTGENSAEFKMAWREWGT